MITIGLIDCGLIEPLTGELWYAHEHLGNKNNEANNTDEKNT